MGFLCPQADLPFFVSKLLWREEEGQICSPSSNGKVALGPFFTVTISYISSITSCHSQSRSCSIDCPRSSGGRQLSRNCDPPPPSRGDHRKPGALSPLCGNHGNWPGGGWGDQSHCRSPCPSRADNRRDCCNCHDCCNPECPHDYNHCNRDCPPYCFCSGGRSCGCGRGHGNSSNGDYHGNNHPKRRAVSPPMAVVAISGKNNLPQQSRS